jgi:hypothetical protein
VRPEDVSAAAGVAGVLVTAAAAIGALLFAAKQVRAGRENTVSQIKDTQERECRQRVDQYLARLNHVEFLPLVAEAIDLLRTPLAGRDAAVRHLVSGETVKSLRTGAFLNFFEEVAGQYNAGMLDKQAARRELVPMAVHYWTLGEWFIHNAQARQPTAFNQWQKMVNEVALEDFMADYTQTRNS